MRFLSSHTMLFNHSLRTALASLLVGVLLIPHTVRAQEAATPLAEGQARNDSLATGAVHTYTVDLGAGQFVYGEADQQTVDVVVTVYGPDGKTLDTYDIPARGPEPFQFSSDTVGPHRIEIKPFEQEQGRYAISVERIEPVATAPESRVDQLMAAYRGDDVPGGVVGVVRDGEVTFAEGYGMANLTYDVPFSTGTPSNIGSVSKQFTAFAIMLLAERGKLSLDDPVREHIPQLPAFDEKVTLRHLLTHTSGYREYLNTLALAGRRLDKGDHISREEVIGVVQRQPKLQNKPGAEWNYNNTGYNLLATVVERVTDKPFPTWMKQNVFEPLGMSRTVVRPQPSQIVPGIAQGYKPAEDGGYREASGVGDSRGAGGIFTTVEDLANWTENLEAGTLGGKDVIRRMTTPYALADGDTTDYGFGLFIGEQRGLKRIQHGGADGGYRAMLMYYPEIDAGAVAMSNSSTFDLGIAGRVAEAFLDEHMTEEPGTDGEGTGGASDSEEYDSEAFDALAGKYKLEGQGMILTFTREGETFFVQPTGRSKMKITPTSDSTFVLQGVEARVTFHRETGGNADSLTLHRGGEQRAHRVEPWTPSAADRAAYTGRYFSGELQTFYTVAAKDSQLVVQHRRMEDKKLAPTKEDTFSGELPIGEVVFTRSKAGAVTGLTVSNGRTRGVRFEKQD